jgi:BioD-like phosphotransacetylase family protein
MISVAEDTFTTVDRIEAVMGKTGLADRVKIERAKDLVRTGFDLKWFLKNLK